MEKEIKLKDNEINIILQALSLVNVPVKDAPIVISLMEKINVQVKAQLEQNKCQT